VLADGSVNVSVERDEDLIGFVARERVVVSSKYLTFDVRPESVKKLASMLDSLKYTHLDMRIIEMCKHNCRGILPELWGLVPMSIRTLSLIRSTTNERF